MQKNILEALIKFIFKYIWIFCFLLITLEIASVLYSADILMKNSAPGILKSTAGEVSNRVDSTVRMLRSLAEDRYIADTQLPLFERAAATRPFKNNFDLYMVAVTDRQGDVVSSNNTQPPKTFSNLMYRDYMQRLYTTGTMQITDPIIAGADGKTLNYTIAVPIMQNGRVEGTVFGAIYFKDIQSILLRNSADSEQALYLFGREQSIISGNGKYASGTAFEDFISTAWYLNADPANIKNDMAAKKDGSFWVLGPRGFCYILYTNIPITDWTLFYSVNFPSMLLPLLPVSATKILLYILISIFVSTKGRKYLENQLVSIKGLLNRISALQVELFKSDSDDYNDIVNFSKAGLVDQLTGLSTRPVLFRKMKELQYDNEHHGAVIFIDLDGLKQINDSYGHHAGDILIAELGKILKDFEEKYGAIAARYGGDEFLLVLDLPAGSKIEPYAEELLQTLNKKITVDGNNIKMQASIGIAMYPKDGTTPENLIGKADIALYSVKNNGKNNYAIYENDM